MSTRFDQIDEWVAGVAADRRLKRHASCRLVAFQHGRNTDAAEFARSGQLVSKQRVERLAARTGLSERAVQYANGLLEEMGHLAIEVGGGRKRTNRCTLLKQTLQPIAPFQGVKPRNRLHPFQRRKGATADAKGCNEQPERVQPVAPEPYNQEEPSRARDTEAGAPRRALMALGALGERVCKRIGADNYAAWFEGGEVEVVEKTDDTIRLSVKSPLHAEQIFNRYETQIARAAGVRFVKIEVRQAVARPVP